MGTRHLTGVVVDGDFKVAQYGQWDGYPGGQGATVLAFLKQADLEDFREKVRALRWINDEDQAAIDAKWKEIGSDGSGWVTLEQADAFNADPRFTHLSRDIGADVLQMIADGRVEFVGDHRDFALDSLFCEWAYVVDLDRNVLEAYRGFQKEPVTTGRWAGQLKTEDHRDDQYHPVALVAEFPINDLPSEEDFCATLEDQEDD